VKWGPLEINIPFNWQIPRLIRCELSRLHCHGYSFLLQAKTEGEFFLQRLRTPSPKSDLPPPGLSRIWASPARRLWHYFFHFRPLVQTLGRGPTVGTPWSFSTTPSLGRGLLAPLPPLMYKPDTHQPSYPFVCETEGLVFDALVDQMRLRFDYETTQISKIASIHWKKLCRNDAEMSPTTSLVTHKDLIWLEHLSEFGLRIFVHFWQITSYNFFVRVNLAVMLKMYFGTRGLEWNSCLNVNLQLIRHRENLSLKPRAYSLHALTCCNFARK